MVFFTLELCSCATMFGSANNTEVTIVNAQSNQPVYVNAVKTAIRTDQQGKATIVLPDANDGNSIKIGVQGRVLPVQTSMQSTAFLNILFPPGFLVDALSGKLMQVDPKIIDVSQQ